MKLYLTLAIACVLMVCSCVKEPQPPTVTPTSTKMPEHVDDLVGTKKWHYIFTDAKPTHPQHTSHTLPDVSFEIVFVDSLHVLINPDTLTWVTTTTDNLIEYHKNGKNTNTFHLAFDYVTGKINYAKNIFIDTISGHEVHFYFTP